ncbi:uncharacterized protein BX663DRAFT_486676 [Cokeromyces recurvatus]|uniref:uncharacterized protein n=1 Tax=Cokeromyces recurvatus TaxID=90255 RepID=UPI00221FC353|nr:uncharacterized protein BX663DRAFT_486676 [Cokeromyces recurvatus]KAI7902358.1 hypothetical protein BX663DRAFT_486676 [Cokeromyces recurvatus]
MSIQKDINKIVKSTDVATPMDEDVPDLTLLIESLKLSSDNSSQTKLPTFETLIKLPENQLQSVLTCLDFITWPEDVTADLLKMIADTETISNENAVLLIYSTAYVKIMALSSSASRLLMNSIIQLSMRKGQCVINGLIVPLLFQSDLSKLKVEVIVKSLQELSSSQRLSLLRILLSDGEIYFSSKQNRIISSNNRNYLRPWNDTVFQVINTILSVQPFIQFTRETLFDLIQPVRAIVQEHPKDKGSMQLLLLLTSKYAQTLIEFSAIDMIEDICNMSSMFLKRAVLGQITSIRKKQEGALKLT